VRSAQAQAPAIDEPAPASLVLDPVIAQRLLEELLYEHLRARIDMMHLEWFEGELDHSIQKIVDKLGGDAGGPPPEVIAEALMTRAWNRLQEDWKVHRWVSPECKCCVATEIAERRRRPR
jgi:hypothetical protein